VNFVIVTIVDTRFRCHRHMLNRCVSNTNKKQGRYDTIEGDKFDRKLIEVHLNAIQSVVGGKRLYIKFVELWIWCCGAVGRARRVNYENEYET
jgi:hypothetical protein